MMNWYGNGIGAGGWVAMMGIFWGLVILAGVMIFRDNSGSRSGIGSGTQDRGAVEILDDRFVRGEVDSEEYEARKAALRGSAR